MERGSEAREGEELVRFDTARAVVIRNGNGNDVMNNVGESRPDGVPIQGLTFLLEFMSDEGVTNNPLRCYLTKPLGVTRTDIVKVVILSTDPFRI